MLPTPLNASQGNSYTYPAITITAAHRESLAEPAHTPVLSQSSKNMFSAKPAKRPGRAGFRWFTQSSSSKRSDAQASTTTQKRSPQAQAQNCASTTAKQRPPQAATQETSQPPPALCAASPKPAPQWYNLANQKPSYPLPQAHMPSPRPLPLPQPSPQPGCQPSVQENSQPRSVPPSGQSGTKDSESFDTWMAKFCIEPPTDTGACCLAFWAPYAQYGKTHWRLKQVEDGQDPSNVSWQSKDGCNGPCWAWFAMSLFQCDCKFPISHAKS